MDKFKNIFGEKVGNVNAGFADGELISVCGELKTINECFDYLVKKFKMSKNDLYDITVSQLLVTYSTLRENSKSNKGHKKPKKSWKQKAQERYDLKTSRLKDDYDNSRNIYLDNQQAYHKHLKLTNFQGVEMKDGRVADLGRK